MQKINTKKLLYHLRHKYLTLNNIVLAVAMIIAANWAIGSISMMQRNYNLQRSLDLKERQQTIAEIEVAKLEYEQNYYQTDEYKELAVREYLGLASPGEKVLILPPNSPEASKAQDEFTNVPTAKPPSNFNQWMNFLFGGNHRNLQN